MSRCVLQVFLKCPAHVSRRAPHKVTWNTFGKCQTCVVPLKHTCPWVFDTVTAALEECPYFLD